MSATVTEQKIKAIDYWVGMLDISDVHNVGLAGVSFNRFTNPIAKRKTRGGEDEKIRTERVGSIIKLEPEEVKAVKYAASIRVTRKRGRGEHTSGSVYVTHRKENGKWVSNPRFRSQAGDVPLADQIFMVPLSEMNPANLVSGDFTPEPMSKTMG